MSKTFFTSDLHFGHNNVIKYDKPIKAKGSLGLWNYEVENDT